MTARDDFAAEVDKGYKGAVEEVAKHAERCIEFVRELTTVSALRNKVSELIECDAEAISMVFEHIDHACQPAKGVLLVHGLNMRLLFGPMMAGFTSGDSLAAYKERVIAEIQRERDKMIHGMREFRDKHHTELAKYLRLVRKASVVSAMEELHSGATKH